jgi:hypothetical protein
VNDGKIRVAGRYVAVRQMAFSSINASWRNCIKPREDSASVPKAEWQDARNCGIATGSEDGKGQGRASVA